jgi:benzylsuccinate CoA-transferase BbsF subunit
MGAGGPRSFYGGVSWGIQAMAGLNALSGFRDRPPVSPSPFSHPDVSCNPIHAMVAILAALRHRRRTGRGQMIELAQYESSIAWTGPALLQYTANGTLMEQAENRSPAAAPHDVFRCRGEDRWCAIAVSTDAQWRALCQVIGRPELVDDARYATLLARKANEADFKAIVEPWTTLRDASDVMVRLQSAGVPCGTVDDSEMLLRGDPQLAHRQYFREVEHPELGTAVVEGWGVRLSRAPAAAPVRAPLLGEHNDYVFQQVLGMSEDEVDMFIVDEVLR